jgi:hypothetical protein
MLFSKDSELGTFLPKYLSFGEELGMIKGLELCTFICRFVIYTHDY